MSGVTYGHVYPWNRAAPGAPAVNRPYAEIVLQGPLASPRIWCLVDSGADRIQVERSFAATAGIAASGSIHAATAAGGSTTLDVAHGVMLSVEGITGSETCYFGNNAVPILGRITFLNVLQEVGFDATSWMHL